jgi:hypothetical protein
VHTLLAVQVICGGAAVALGLARRPRVSPWELLAEVVMVVAMLDLHLAEANRAPGLFWAAALAVLALGTALRHRLRQGASPEMAADDLHPLGMLLGASLVLLALAPSGVSTTGAPGAHAHGGAELAVVVAACVAVYAVVVVVRTFRWERGLESAYAAASLAGLLLMGGMVAFR